MIRSGMMLMIREKVLEGKSSYAIAKEIGLSKNTVKKYRELGSQMVKVSTMDQPSKLDPHLDMIQSCMAAGIFNCQVILERIQQKGYDGGITILKDYVKPYRPPKALPAVPRYETPPGKQAQMDYGICHYVDLDGVIHKIPAFIMIMGNSRAKYVEFVKRCDLYSLQRCLINAFEYFGGVPETILTDRMKTVIIGTNGKEIIWNTKFQEFARDMGFVPKVCRARRPQTKGKVERLVHYVKDNFLPGRAFTDLADLNLQAMVWCRKADSRIHSTTGLIPLKELKKEPLLPLPERRTRDRYRYETRRVSSDGFVSYDGVRYGVPWHYSGKELRVRLYDGIFQAFDGLICIAEHKALYKSRGRSLLPGQYQGLVQNHGMPITPSYGLQIPKEVEIRPLSVYDQLAGVM
jgi:transposase